MLNNTDYSPKKRKYRFILIFALAGDALAIGGSLAAFLNHFDFPFALLALSAIFLTGFILSTVKALKALLLQEESQETEAFLKAQLNTIYARTTEISDADRVAWLARNKPAGAIMQADLDEQIRRPYRWWYWAYPNVLPSVSKFYPDGYRYSKNHLFQDTSTGYSTPLCKANPSDAPDVRFYPSNEREWKYTDYCKHCISTSRREHLMLNSNYWTV